jgi:WD40 repeat protein/energy-coupling factor transporter ATP-binding protein EcfA2
VDALGVRDDVHDFGWILWELLTAAPPEPGSMAPTGGRPERGAAPSLVGRTGDVPEGLDAVLARATDPAGGYSTIAELVLGWRAAVGRPDGVLSPVTSDERRVVDSARRLAARRLAEATAAGINPYKGLRPFDEADAAGFFGRDAVADELAEWVAHHRLVTVVGPSGSGKSSLVRAGLMPRLRATGSTVAAMVPGQDPVAALRQALSELSSRRGRNTDVLAWIRHVVAACGPLVVVIDQFEECWSRGDVDRRAAFIADLARLVDSDLDVRFVATIRADVFDRPLEEPRLGTHVGSGAFVIASMSPAQLADAITLPAARAGISVNDAVVADLVTDAVNQPGSLPLLQFTLAEMYDRRVDGRIGPDALAAVGGMAGSIGRRAEDVHASLDASAQEDAHLLFSRLVIPGEAAPDTRRRARLSELPAGARAVADRYADARLLVTDRDQVTREPTVEIAHEALLTRWSRLAGWVDADRTWLAQLQHLAASARAWDERGRPPADLYRGSRLEAAIESIDAGRDVTDSERDFVEAGGDARDSEVRSARRTARRLRRLLVGVGVLLVLAIVAGTLAYVGQQRARDEERDAAHRALVSDSTALRSSDRDLAALLAVEAHRLDPSPATESALFGTFTAVPGLERTVHPGVEHEGGAVLIDDETMAVQRITGGARVIDIATGEVKYSLTMLDGGADSYITWLDATPDGRYLAMAWRAEDRGVLNVFDLATQRARFENVDVPYAMGNVAISPDGSLVAIGGGADARADVYDAATGELLVELDPIPRPEDAVLVVNTVALAFRSDDELIVTSQTGTIRIVDPTTGRELKRFQGDRETAEAFLLLSGDANSMVTLGWHGINRYDLVSGEALWPRPLLGDPAETGRTCTLGLAERLGVALCGQDDGVVRAIDLDTGVLGSTDIGPRAGRICSLMDTPDGSQLVATVCESNEYIVWRLDGGGAVSRAILSEDQLAQDESVTRLVDVATRTAEPLPGIFAPVPTGDPSVVVARFDDGRGTASTGLYDLTTRTAASPTFDLDFEPFGALEVDGSFYVWGDENGDVAEFLGHVAAVGPDGRIRFEVAAPFTSYLYVAATDADHVVVVKCEKRTDCVLQRLDPATGAPVGEPSEDEAGYSRVVATPGLLIALTGAGQIRVIDPETLLPVGAPLPRIPGGAESLSLSDDGRRLLVLGQDAAFRVYDVPSRTQLGGPVTVGDFASGAALRGDGLEAAVGTDHGIVLWDLDAAHWIDGACAVAGRNLTRAEWDQYIGDLASYRTTCSEYAPAE